MEPVPLTGPDRHHQLAIGISLALIGILVALTALELALRLSGYHRQFAQRDATIGYVLTPNFARSVPILEHAGGSVLFRTNNLGLRRNTDTASVKPTGTLRILVLGDSQTEGMVNNEEAYSAGLERALNEAPVAQERQRKVEVLNAAASGYSPLLEYLWLRERGRALKPDLVLLALYAGNDIGELLMHYEDFGGFGPRFALPFLEQTNSGWHIEPPGTDAGVWGCVDWSLQTHLRVYALVRRVLPRTQPPDDRTFQRVLTRCSGCAQSMWQAFVAHGDPSALAGAFSKLDYLLRQFQIESAQLKTRLVVVIIPSKLEVEAERTTGVPQAMAACGLRYDAIAFDAAVRRRIVALAEGHGILTVDLQPSLRAAALERGQPLFWQLDWHLDVEGHRVVTQQLLPVVSRLLHVELPTPSTTLN